jgi:hypothetical protein
VPADVQGDDVGVADVQEDFLLGVQVHELVLLKDLLLAHDLESVDLIAAPKLDQFDPAEGAVAQRREHFQVVTLQFPEDLLAVLLEGVQLRLLHSL